MYKNMKIGVTVPAYNEQKFISKVIDTMPDFVDKIYLVNDASMDQTWEIMSNKAKTNSKIVPINRERNGGVGAAILTGHKRGLLDDIDVVAVMAGDGQMDPAILINFILPIIEGKADYTKGNRLSNRHHRKEMPVWRKLGNFMLTNMTRIASGYWRISDPQDGYTAISVESLKQLDLDKIEKGFTFENDMLVKLNCIGARVIDIPHPAIYRGQNSKICYFNFIFSTSFVLFKDFIWRLWSKYIIKTYKHIFESTLQ
jgi:glycosyltransferase involved in cell wall biosynthesis